MTYALLALIFLAVAALTALSAAVLVRPPREWWLATGVVAVVLCVLTAVFDSAMISTDLFRYDTSSLLGLRIWLVPVEDFAWPLAAALTLPSLWELLGLAHNRDDAADRCAGGSPTERIGASTRDH